ncbi:hypothetical protein IDH44_04940 [Paenibacillus sp. IB182496]|uniref:Sulfatase-modifying factor enzyme domain-containing protein n=1 Tax=Paenibacillus sabuli TaxID=2772509 RepID=A0A927BPV7_9BACL|nr:hypothetical protein [Paenibacillus sabuli]MBD2844527.1 hypothetical protein [Paenibacillus sabuli]
MNQYDRTAYVRLNSYQRQSLLESLTALHPNLKFKRFACFERFGMRTDTAIYELEGSEFVFVPGDSVTLGWSSFAVGPDEKTSREFEDTLAEYGAGELLSLLADTLSPERTATVGPMLAECRLREIGWHTVAADSPKLTPRQQEAIEKFQSRSGRMLTIHKSLRLTRTDGGTLIELYEPRSYEQLLHGLRRDCFALPTEDEWEYLCGGGSRTLWRWGDSFDYGMRIRHFDDPELAGKPYELELPNQFGLSIAYDPYRYEVVDAPCLLKGGDGGSNICGGLGVAMGYLPVATAFRCWPDDNMLKEYKLDIGGDHTFYRRIIRLSENA